jgi:phage shock protein PspC (stress-responsive transcriptional regulator)
VIWQSLERPAEGRLVAGVCEGVSRATRVDVNFLRLAFVVLALANGIGLLAYLVLWVSIRDEGHGGGSWQEIATSNVRGITSDSIRAGEGFVATWFEDDPRLDGPRRRQMGFGLIAAGAFVLFYSLGFFAWLGLSGSLGVAAIVVGSAVLASAGPRR